MTDAVGKPKGRGGRRPGAGQKKGGKKLTPAIMAKAMLPSTVTVLPAQSGGSYPMKPGYVDPIDFCLAVMNNDTELLKKLGMDMSVKKRPGPSIRLEAARIAAPYTNRKLPTELHVKDKRGWADTVRGAENRVSTMRQPYERPDADADDGDRSPGAIH